MTYVRLNNIAIDLLKKMLTFIPEDRITAMDALEHEYFNKYHKIDSFCTKDLTCEFLFESKKIEYEEIKQLLLHEILLYNDKELYEEYTKLNENIIN